MESLESKSPAGENFLDAEVRARSGMKSEAFCGEISFERFVGFKRLGVEETCNWLGEQISERSRFKVRIPV